MQVCFAPNNGTVVINFPHQTSNGDKMSFLVFDKMRQPGPADTATVDNQHLLKSGFTKSDR
jgi:hypothetical protein